MMMQILDGLAHVLKVLQYSLLWQQTIPELDFFIQRSSFCELQNHVGDIFLFFVIVVDKFDYIRMV